jgi:glycosyltransferase involved in cell wall biosynthesis
VRLPVGFLLLLALAGVAWLCVAVVELVVAAAASVVRGFGGPLARAQVGAALRRARRAEPSGGLALVREPFRRRETAPSSPSRRPRLLFLLGRMPRAGRDGSWVVLERLAALRDLAQLEVLSDLPAVYVCHESLGAAELASPRPDDPAWRERIGRSVSFERRVLARHRRTIALSGSDAAVLGALAGTEPLVVPSAVRPMRAQPDPGHRNLSLFVGNFAHPPNVDAVGWLLGEIWPRVRRLAPGAGLAIVGRHAAPSAPADGIVQFGPADDLEPWFRQAAVVIAPLRTGAGLRGKLLEAWARGKAVVATAQAAAGFAARPGIDYLRAEGADEFAAAVVACLADESLRLRLGSAALQYVRDRHDPVPLAREFLDLVLEARDCAPGAG